MREHVGGGGGVFTASRLPCSIAPRSRRPSPPYGCRAQASTQRTRPAPANSQPQRSSCARSRGAMSGTALQGTHSGPAPAPPRRHLFFGPGMAAARPTRAYGARPTPRQLTVNPAPALSNPAPAPAKNPPQLQSQPRASSCADSALKPAAWVWQDKAGARPAGPSQAVRAQPCASSGDPAPTPAPTPRQLRANPAPARVLTPR